MFSHVQSPLVNCIPNEQCGNMWKHVETCGNHFGLILSSGNFFAILSVFCHGISICCTAKECSSGTTAVCCYSISSIANEKHLCGALDATPSVMSSPQYQVCLSFRNCTLTTNATYCEIL